MGVYSDGSYDVPAGLIFSFPVTSKNGEWSIVQGTPSVFPIRKVPTCSLGREDGDDVCCLLRNVTATVALTLAGWLDCRPQD